MTPNVSTASDFEYAHRDHSGGADATVSDAQSRELQLANRRLVEESELLRLALAETDTLRQREAAVLRERTILFESLTVLSNARSSSAALDALLAHLHSTYESSPVCLLLAREEGALVHASADKAFCGQTVPMVASALEKSRRLASLTPMTYSIQLPEGFDRLRSVLIVPLPIPGASHPSALLLGAATAGHFGGGDLRVIERIAALAYPVLTGLHEAEERERLQRELQVAQRREMVGQMAAGLAHDFNNLLAAISGNASLIESDAQPDSAQSTGALRIQSAVEQAANLVRRLLALGAKEPSRSVLDLKGPLHQAADLLRVNLPASLKLELKVAEDSLKVLADPTDVLQLLLNLGINARDAMDGKTGAITLSLGVATSDDLAGECVIGHLNSARRYMALAVTDQGSGIPHDKLALLFKRYITTKGNKGSGLGLAIVTSIVNANQAALKVISRPDEGSRFLILWPEKDDDVPASELSGPTLSGNLKGRSILVVDDQQDVLSVISQMLEEAGAEVAPTDVPHDVIEAVKDDPGAWDLVITDYDMPGICGDVLAQHLRKVAPELPILLVTALAAIRPLPEGLFDDCIAKPLDKHRLIHTVERLITHGKQGDTANAHSDR